MSLYVVIGGSRGIGGEVSRHLVEKRNEVLSVSRTLAPFGTWGQADVGTLNGVRTVSRKVGNRPLDGLLFMGGIWEKGAFTKRYSFLDCPVEEIQNVIAVNLTAPILLAQGLAENLALAPNPRIVLMGSLTGLPNTASPEVANTASKFGLQGAAEALNLSLRPLGISTTVINPGNVSTAEVEQDIADGSFSEQVPIPLVDIIKTVDYTLMLSRATAPTAISLHQTSPGS